MESNITGLLATIFRQGIKDSLPIVIEYMPVAFAFGLNAVKLGFTPLEGLFISCIIYVSTRQFVITTMPMNANETPALGMGIGIGMGMDVHHLLHQQDKYRFCMYQCCAIAFLARWSAKTTL